MVPTLITKVDSLETKLKQTKQTMGKAIVKLGEDQEEEISPTTLEAVKTLSKVASQRSKSVDKVNTGGLGFSTGSGPVSSDRGQREGQVQMIVEETQAPKRTKEKIQQEEASLAEAIRFLAEEEELTEQQKQRKAQVQFEAQHYTEEDWDAIRAKLEANAELAKSVIAKDMSEEDFAKRMVDLLKKLKFKEIKEEFDKLVKQVDTFVP
ncbi:hypothetical protein Tco_0931876, partial [Tanacetum coccineum]